VSEQGEGWAAQNFAPPIRDRAYMQRFEIVVDKPSNFSLLPLPPKKPIFAVVIEVEPGPEP